MPSDLKTFSQQSLNGEALEARTWLLEAAAPLWSKVGRTPSGLFAERMTLAGEPDASYFRILVQARHIYSFVVIGKLGWRGAWRDLVSETTEALIRAAKRDDGFYVHRLSADARPLDSRADLYDQAFVLLALGTAGGALARNDWFDEAEALLDRLEGDWNHPLGGFREGEIADIRFRRQNPHMHLLEAFLALHEASGRCRFFDAALVIAELAREKFLDGATGALLEYFTDDLDRAGDLEGRIVEPGHCFEWAWLFERLQDAGWASGAALSDGLTAFARGCGIDEERNVAINEVLVDGTVRDASARLWPQTERLKAATSRHRRLGSDFEAQAMMNAALGLRKYLDVAVAGLWRDKLKRDGGWVEEMVPGSSLYHITCAYSELMNTESRA